jgi:hypothetical protein
MINYLTIIAGVAALNLKPSSGSALLVIHGKVLAPIIMKVDRFIY